jgi:hypothetical protein
MPDTVVKLDANAMVDSSAPIAGNTKHGLRSTGWPKGTERERRAVGAYGRALREAVLAAGGQLDIVTAGLINTAMRWERHASLAARWLRLEHASLTPDQRLSYSRETARASSERDRAVAALGLKPTTGKDPWSALDAPWRDAGDGMHKTDTSGSNGDSTDQEPTS